jgi:hypothetical protein
VRWVGHSLKAKHKTDRKAISSELLAHYHTEGQTFLSQNVTADEAWVCHFELQARRQSMQWHHPQYSQKKKIQKVSINELRHDHCIQGR